MFKFRIQKICSSNVRERQILFTIIGHWHLLVLWMAPPDFDNEIFMKQQQDEFLSEPEQMEDIVPIKQQHQELPSKAPSQTSKAPYLKRIQIEREKEFCLYRPFKLEKPQQSSSEEEEIENKNHQSPFKEFYVDEQCVYLRHNNSVFNRFKNQTFYSGQFVNRNVLADSNCSQTHEIADILKQYYDIDPVTLATQNEGALSFDSKFESGNLFAAFKVSDTEYDLVMQNDTNSVGSNQWFYFSVQGMKPGQQYTFSVINYTKSDSLFNYGMKPVVYSLAENKHVFDVEKGWRRTGTDISYKKGKLHRENSHRLYYRLTFKLSTPYDRDKLWVAHSYPYTYQKLAKMIHEKVGRHKQYVSLIEVGRTLSKRAIEALVISYPINKKRDNRKAVVITARQHPGQTQGSYVCEGVIEKLLSKSKETELLLKNYVFYVIPMINPDGVVFGHYRTNLAGKDLNRKWNSTEKDSNCPQVTAIKTFLTDINKTREIRFILDLHGHSRKLNSFFYGNPYPECPEAVRIFPFICSKLHTGVQYLQCTFSTEEYKRKAARVYLNYIFKLVHVYTFESSFFAYEKEDKKIEFTQKEYRDLGGTLISGLCLQLEHEIKYQQALEFNIKKNSPKEYLNSVFVKYLVQLKNNSLLLEQGGQGESGSDSKPEQGEINIEEIQYQKMSKVPSSMNKDTKSKSHKIPRKAASEMKDQTFARPTRNLRYLQLSKINSFLPDKEGFCLQPIKKKEPEPVSKSLKTVASCQTELPQNYEQFREFNVSEVQQANLSNSYMNEQNTERKASSLVRPMHNKNNVIFRLEFMTNTTEHQLNQRKKKPIKNALSQTILSFSCSEFQREKKEKTEHYSENISEKGQKGDWWLRAGQIKLETPFSSLMLKKDAATYFNGMVHKFISRKEHSRSHDMAMSRLDRSFSIRKKETRR